METPMEKKLRLAKELIEIYLDPKCLNKTELDLTSAISLIEDSLKLNKDLDTDSGKTKMFAVVSKDENKPKELLLATTKKQAIILYNHWHYKFGKLNENLYVKEFKI